MRSVFLILTWQFLMFFSVNAQQVIEVSADGTIVGEISLSGITRLHLVKDEVASVQVNEGGQEAEVSFVKESSTGDLYLKLTKIQKSTFQSSVSFFLTTKRGYTYQVKLLVTNRASTQISVKNPEITKQTYAPTKINQKLEDNVIEIVRAIINGNVLTDFRITEPRETVRTLGSLRFYTDKIYMSESLTGQLLIIYNPTISIVSISETMFMTPGILAVSILGNKYLRSNQSTKVLLIGLSNGDSLL